MHASNMCASKNATYGRSMGVCTPHITQWSATVITRMELIHVELPTRLEKNLGTIGIPKSPACKSWLAWRNLRNLSRKPTRETRNIAIMKKVTATQTPFEVLGLVVLGKIKLVVRNLKLIVN